MLLSEIEIHSKESCLLKIAEQQGSSLRFTLTLSCFHLTYLSLLELPLLASLDHLSSVVGQLPTDSAGSSSTLDVSSLDWTLLQFLLLVL